MKKKDFLTEMRKYKTRTDFYKKNRKLYKKLNAEGIFNKYANQVYKPKPKLFWSKENIIKELQKYSSRSEIWDKACYVIAKAKRLGILEEALSHLPPKPIPKPKRIRKPRGIVITHLQKNELLKLADEKSIGCQTKTEFYKKNPAITFALKKHRLLKKFVAKFPNGIQITALKNTKWTIETIQKEALKYTKRYSFSKGSPGAYNAAKKLKILNQVCHHMSNQRNAKYSKEFVLKEALKYKTKEEFREKAKNLYNSAWERGFYKEATKHMITVKRNLEEKEYPRFDRLFKPYFKIYKTNRDKKLFGFTPDRVLQRHGKFYVVEIKRDHYSHNCNDQIKKYKKIAKKVFKVNLGGVFLTSRNGKYKNAYSFTELLIYLTS